MKKLVLLCFIFLNVSLFSQVGIKLMHIRPTGNMGASLKPAVGFELIYKPFDDESDFKFRFGVGYAKFKSRLDTFPTYGTISGGGTTVTPGWTVINKYSIVTLMGGFDYHVTVNDKLSFYPGIDLGAMFSIVAYDSYAPLISSESYSGGYTYFGSRLRLGGEYLIIEDIGIFAEYTRGMHFSPEVGPLGYNDYSIGVRLNF